MSLPLTTTQVTLIKRTVEVSTTNGNDVETFTPMGTYKAVVEQQSAVENTSARDATTTLYEVYLNPGIDVTFVDEIQWGNIVMKVQGDPAFFPNVKGFNGHIKLVGKVTSG